MRCGWPLPRIIERYDLKPEQSSNKSNNSVAVEGNQEAGVSQKARQPSLPEPAVHMDMRSPVLLLHPRLHPPPAAAVSLKFIISCSL